MANGGDTDMGWVCSCIISYVFLAFLCFFCNAGESSDSLRRGESITPNRTLLSASGNFAESPLPPQDSEAIFTLGYDGNLQLLGGGGRNSIWSTNISGGNSTAAHAQLQDTGDLIVKQGESIVWESFEGDSDTFMSGMRLKVNKKTGKRNVIRCWSSSDDPRPGKFSWGIDPKGSPQFFIWKEDVPYYRSNLYQEGFTYSIYFPSGGYAYYYCATENDEEYLSYGFVDTSVQARFILKPEGYIQYLWRQKTSEKWSILGQVPTNECELYARCGSFGTCERYDSHPICSCLKGFKPKSQKHWDKGKYDAGCERSIALGCGQGEDDGFMRLPLRKWPDHSSSLGNITFKECEMECSNNCSCTAFAYANITSYSAVNCINWFVDLVDLAHNYSSGGFGQDLYVRVHASELSGSSGNDHSSHKNKRRLVAIIVALVSAFFLIIVLVYILTWKYCGRKGWVCEKSRESSDAPLLGKDDIELLQLSFRRIIDATNNFDEANKLGEGGFGPVYKGFLSEFGIVAIKRLSKQSSQGLKEFMNELKLIAKLQHTNLVRLLGCCIEGRYLRYQGMNPKISDFGMARIFGIDQTQVETNHVIGTYGYIPPEYVMQGQFFKKSDVFSFGVLLLEIAWENWKEGRALEFVDPAISESCESLKVVSSRMNHSAHRAHRDWLGPSMESAIGQFLMGVWHFGECEDQCYNNCSCTAFAYANISERHPANCLNWFGDLVDFTYNYYVGVNGFGQDLYVRVHSSELDNGSSGNGHSDHYLVAKIVGPVSGFFLVCVLVYILKRRSAVDNSMSSSPLVGNDEIELLQFSLQRIIDATNNFDTANKLGEGGFGPVYKGFLSEFGMVVIKRLLKRSSQGLEEFMKS
nr:receptor-like serine/threonine-protein kinase SD1-8 [Ipomoea batatas]